jgi:hypothetical protein
MAVATSFAGAVALVSMLRSMLRERAEPTGEGVKQKAELWTPQTK